MVLDIGQQITLGDFERAVCKRLAQLRHDVDRGLNIYDRKVGPQSNEETDLQGVGSEMAFCKLTGIYPDLELDPGRNAYDFIMPSGVPVDIKSTKYRTGRLVVPPWKEPQPGLFVLMTGEFPTFTFAGAIEQKKALVPENLKSLGHNIPFVVDRDQLHAL